MSDAPCYTFWDFQEGAWRRDNGIRIDHLMLSPQAADRLNGVTVHEDVRGWDKPSDHVPSKASSRSRPRRPGRLALRKGRRQLHAGLFDEAVADTGEQEGDGDRRAIGQRELQHCAGCPAAASGPRPAR